MKRISKSIIGALIAFSICASAHAGVNEALVLRDDSVQLRDLEQHFRRGGQGSPLLLIHGLTNTWQVWRPYLGILGEAHDLVVPDLRGHGTTANPSSTLSPGLVAEDMFGLLDALGIGTIQIVGYSFGGHVAMRMAALQPARVEAMVVIAGAHQLLGSAKAAHEELVRAEIPSDWWLKAVSGWHPGGEKQVRDLLRQGAASGLAEDFAMSDSAMASIRARTLIIQGDRDEIFPLEVPLDMYRKIRGAQLWIIPRTDHNTVFWQDVAPPDTDFGGGVLASKVFPDAVLTFLRR